MGTRHSVLVSYLLLWLPALLSQAAESNYERAPVPLCTALELLQANEQIPVTISGVYSYGYFYDPEQLSCEFGVGPTICLEFASGVKPPAELQELYQETERVAGTFTCVLPTTSSRDS